MKRENDCVSSPLMSVLINIFNPLQSFEILLFNLFCHSIETPSCLTQSLFRIKLSAVGFYVTAEVIV